MKVIILSLTLVNNYGGCLQAYAMLEILKKLGHQPIAINRQKPKPSLPRLVVRFAKRLMAKFLLGRSDLVVLKEFKNAKEIADSSREISRFIDEWVQPRSKPCYTTKDMKRFVAKQEPNAVIVGSDQVWRLAYAANIYENFLSFVPDNVKKISYAASFGLSDWEYSMEQTKTCKELLKRFDAVSVREDSAVELCQKYLEVDPQHVLDPTMLLEKEDYQRIALTSKITVPSKLLLVYVLDRDEQRLEIIESLARHLNLTPFYINFTPYSNSGESKRERATPVEDWLRLFMSAEFVFTDSFHGTVFSILFNRPFFAFGNKQRGFARFASLLNSFGLISRLIQNLKDIPSFENLNDIDWALVNNQLDKRKSHAMEFLKMSLN